MTTEQLAANRISINSAEQDDHIDSVTVFQANHAEVKRRVMLNLKVSSMQCITRMASKSL